MARKPCAQDVAKLPIDCSISCDNKSGRFSRIARNAILPFYYNCRVKDLYNKNECEKIFYIKNPAFYAGSYNNPTNITIAKMKFSHLANEKSRTEYGRRKTIISDNSTISNCSLATSIVNHYYKNPVTQNIPFGNLSIPYEIKSKNSIKESHLMAQNIQNQSIICRCSSSKIIGLKN